MLAMDQIPKRLTTSSQTPQLSPTGEPLLKIPQHDNADNNGDSAYGVDERSPDKNNIDNVPDEINRSTNIVRAISFRQMNN